MRTVPGSLVGDVVVDPRKGLVALPDTATRGASSISRRAKALLWFAFAVMANPVSSVAYAIEAALRALHGHLGLLLPTMGIVIGIIALVTLNY